MRMSDEWMAMNDECGREGGAAKTIANDKTDNTQ